MELLSPVVQPSNNNPTLEKPRSEELGLLGDTLLFRGSYMEWIFLFVALIVVIGAVKTFEALFILGPRYKKLTEQGRRASLR